MKLMSKSAKIGLLVNAILLVLVLFTLAHAQRPPETDETGAAYLRVNINPTNVPPMVNINPYNAVPRVQVTEMPEIKFPPSGCADRANYQTGIGRSISGPMMITYLHLPAQTTVSLTDSGGGRSVDLGPGGAVSTAIFLQPAQTLDFNSDVMYSGCRPQ